MDKLKLDGVNKIILVTHVGLAIDIAVAKRVRDIDVIVGGHSHTVLSDVYKEGGDSQYPLVVNDVDGKPVYIVQAGDRDRYLGRLDLRFDEQGVVTRARGDLILLSKHITPDPPVHVLIERLAGPINELKNRPVTRPDGIVVTSAQAMRSRTCRSAECLLGNLLSDAIRYEAKTDIAITNGGGFRADIDEGEITVGEVLSVLPFSNTVATLKLTGAQIVASLEHGVSRVSGNFGSGRFPQVSGLRYEFDTALEVGSRIINVEVLDKNNEFVQIQKQKLYSVATNNFMRTGGDGYELFANEAIDPYDFGRPMEQALIDYMIKIYPVTIEKDGRISRK